MPNVEKLHDVYSTLVVECYKLKQGKARGQQQDQTKRDFNKIVEAHDKVQPARDKAGDSFKKSLEEYAAHHNRPTALTHTHLPLYLALSLCLFVSIIYLFLYSLAEYVAHHSRRAPSWHWRCSFAWESTA